MSTIADVARRAGVSKMTVSRVINDSGYISQETRQRVEQAIEELGYIPNALARSLRFKQTRTIALILTDITNPFFTTVARGVEDTASEQGFSVIFCNTDESPTEEAEYVNVLMQKQVDGLLLVPTGCSPDSLVPLQDQKLPFVLLDRHIPGAAADTVRCDSEGGAYALTQHLLALGHTRIAILSGPEDVTTASDRVLGYRRALREAGIEPDESLTFLGVHGRRGLLDGPRGHRHTAASHGAVRSNNFIAVGAMRALHEAGLAFRATSRWPRLMICPCRRGRSVP